MRVACQVSVCPAAPAALSYHLCAAHASLHGPENILITGSLRGAWATRGQQCLYSEQDGNTERVHPPLRLTAGLASWAWAP